jgi:hypothetical protein
MLKILQTFTLSGNVVSSTIIHKINEKSKVADLDGFSVSYGDGVNGVSTLYKIKSNDNESVDLLKDASALEIYDSKADLRGALNDIKKRQVLSFTFA